MVDTQDIALAAAAVTAAVAAAAQVMPQDIDAMNAANDAIVAAVAHAAAAIVPPPQQAFALTPAVAVTGIVDYKTREGQKLYSSATYKLEEEPYDCNADGLYQFLKSLAARAEEFGWDNETGGFLRIPKNIAQPLANSENLVEHYGTISIEKIRAWEELYLDRSVRAAQDAYMMHKCLMNSISKTGKDKITIWREQYTVKGMSSGNLLLKIIIRESHLDTNATTSTIRTKLASLDEYILTIGCDITKFNGHVKLLTDGLAARGQTTNDLLEFLFKGYGVVPDQEFRDYIKRKKENHDEGIITTAEHLMLLADNRYKQRLESKEGWGIANPQEEKIIALQAKVDKLSKRKSNGISMNEFQKGGKGKKGNGKNGPAPEKPIWMGEAPPAADMKKPFKPRMWKSKPWYYCHELTGGKCPGNWRVHKPTDCQGKAHQYNSAKEPSKKKAKQGNESRKLKLAKAYVAVGEDNDETEDELFEEDEELEDE